MLFLLLLLLPINDVQASPPGRSVRYNHSPGGYSPGGAGGVGHPGGGPSFGGYQPGQLHPWNYPQVRRTSPPQSQPQQTPQTQPAPTPTQTPVVRSFTSSEIQRIGDANVNYDDAYQRLNEDNNFNLENYISQIHEARRLDNVFAGGDEPRQTGIIDPNQIPDRPINESRFHSQGEFRDRMLRQYQDLYKIRPDTEAREDSRKYGLLTTTYADELYSQGDIGNGELFLNIGRGFLDIAVGLDPVTGFGRSAYELFTGRNLITQEHLSHFERSFAFLGVVTAGGAASVTHASEALVRLSLRSVRNSTHLTQVAESAGRIYHNSANAIASATRFRNSPGTAIVTRELNHSDAILKGTHGSAGLIPRQISDTMAGRTYNNFTEFRRDFWREVANSPYAQEFTRYHPDNLELMRRGRAPRADLSQHVGANTVYTLHHIEEIQHGGSVYDLSNLAVASPRYHTRVFHNQGNGLVGVIHE